MLKGCEGKKTGSSLCKIATFRGTLSFLRSALVARFSAVYKKFAYRERGFAPPPQFGRGRGRSLRRHFGAMVSAFWLRLKPRVWREDDDQ